MCKQIKFDIIQFGSGMKAVKEFGAGELEMTMNIKMCSSMHE